MENNILIEQMTSKDIDGVFEVEKNCFEHNWSKDAFKKELNNEVARYLVAKLDGKVVGYVVIWFVMDEVHITNVSVHSDYIGRKIDRNHIPSFSVDFFTFLIYPDLR